MLKGISKIISPGLLKILMEMGHGDEIVLGDGNFPAASCAKRLVRCDGSNVPELLDAILDLMPLDSYVRNPVALLETEKENDIAAPEIWTTYQSIVSGHESVNNGFEYMKRTMFYDRAKSAYAIIATGETALYANIILRKGVVAE